LYVILEKTLRMNPFKHSLLVIASLFVAGTAFSQGKPLNYSDGDVKLQGYYVKAKTQKTQAPGVVIIHQWMGLTQHEKTAADKLAALGYNALAADIYGPGKTPKNTTEAGETAGFYKTNYQAFQSRIKSAVDQLVKQGTDPSRIVVMGYCFGGTGALEAARAGLPVKGVVSIHGGLGKDAKRSNGPIKASVLILHGADDPYSPQADIDQVTTELREGKADWQMILYSNAVHAFTQPEAGNDNSKGAAYNEAAAKRSWEHLKLFLAEMFNK
jgi:dienelactone hydrolase